MKRLNFGNRKDNSNRKGVPAKERARRRTEAEARNAAFAALSFEEQLKKVAGTPGYSRKQLAKIEGQIAHRDMQREMAAEEAAVKKAFAENSKGKTKKPRTKNQGGKKQK